MNTDAAPEVVQVGRNALVLNGAQLLEALDFIAPDRATDAEQLESEIAIEYGEGHAGKGMYCWCAEYPEEGSWILDGKSVLAALPATTDRIGEAAKTVAAPSVELGEPGTTWQHELKTDPEVFAAVLDGSKTNEIRFNDRDFKIGDRLLLRETRYSGQDMRGPEPRPLEYTGRETTRVVSHVLAGYGLQPGWVILSFARTASVSANVAQGAQHPDDVAVDRFAAAMKEKLAAARAKGRSGWQQESPVVLSEMLRAHVDKGDPRDVANFCMFLWALRRPIYAGPPAQTALTNAARDAIEWAAGRAHVEALGKPIDGPEGKRWRILSDMFRAAQYASADPQ